MSRRRTISLAVTAVVLLVLGWAAWTVYSAFGTYQDLDRAQAAADRLQSAVESGDDATRDAALDDLADAASSAHDRTDGLAWGVATLVPGIGDDARGVEALSASLDTLASDGLVPLLEVSDDLDAVVGGGRIDPAAVAALQEPVRRAGEAVADASAEVAERDTDGYVGVLRERFEEYDDRVAALADGLGAAGTATRVLPTMLGADGPRDYLFVFQNNAEVRATGGIPGSWARVHVEDGTIEVREQGSAADFPPPPRGTVLPLTEEETRVYGEELGRFWQNPGLTPDFPRSAEIMRAHWDAKFPEVPIDGVLSLDPVAMSYLLEGTGPVSVLGVELDAVNVVDAVLSRVYLEVPTTEQDSYFQATARELFAALTRDLRSPVALVQGMARAGREGRLLLAPFDDESAAELAGTRVLGELSGDDGDVPHVDVALNDATGSKMSYYLRATTELSAASCDDDVQRLTGTTTLTQTISAEEAAALPDFVNGGGIYEVTPGQQLVRVQLHAPFGGAIDNVLVDGEDLAPGYGREIDGRQVVEVIPIVDGSAPVVVTYDVATAAGQTGATTLRTTPGVEPGGGDTAIPTAC